MEHPVNRRNQYWIAGLSAVVVLVGALAFLNQQQQQQLQTQVLQDQSTREALQREQSELTLRNNLQSASERETALQLQLREMDAATSRQLADAATTEAGASQRQAVMNQQEAKRQQAERELQDLRAQRVRLEKQVDCERIQLSVNQLKSKGETDQALKLLKLWSAPCPNLQAAQ
jgi:chromosome segregation ATPase